MTEHSHKRRSPCCAEEAWRYMMSGDGGGYTTTATPRQPPQWAQDALDGAALRRLREALPKGYDFQLYAEAIADDGWWVELLSEKGGETLDEATFTGSTVAEAADRCREALPGS